jgi:hypothetical protein
MKTFTFILLLIFGFNSFAGQTGIFMVVKGNVFIQSTDGKRVKAKINSVVNPGESVVSEADSKAKIVMTDRNIVNVLPNTKFTIEKYTNEPGNKNVDLKLESGRIRTDVEEKYDGKDSKFEIRTGVAVLGVRGTQLVVTHDAAKNATELVTLTGEVSVGRIGTLSGAMGFGKSSQLVVKAQQQVLISAEAKTLSVEAVPAKAFEELKKETDVVVEVKEKTSRSN